jgi:hypothetical protein
MTDDEEKERKQIPLPQVRFISVLPFAPPVPVLEFPKPEELEQGAAQLLQLKGISDYVQLLKESRGWWYAYNRAYVSYADTDHGKHDRIRAEKTLGRASEFVSP